MEPSISAKTPTRTSAVQRAAALRLATRSTVGPPADRPDLPKSFTLRNPCRERIGLCDVENGRNNQTIRRRDVDEQPRLKDQLLCILEIEK